MNATAIPAAAGRPRSWTTTETAALLAGAGVLLLAAAIVIGTTRFGDGTLTLSQVNGMCSSAGGWLLQVVNRQVAGACGRAALLEQLRGWCYVAGAVLTAGGGAWLVLTQRRAVPS